MERKLASIQKIIDLQPITNADTIEVATVLGWKVVVKKGEFKVGDLVVYCEVDSILPATPETEFLAPKYRIKTVRLRGQVSQGICFPMTFLPVLKIQERWDITEGADVTEMLGVIKYEPPMPVELTGKIRGMFPSFIPKTDETRIQAYPNILEKYRNYAFYVAEKVDGTSTTFFIKDGEFHVCSRNLDLLEESGNTIWQVARLLDLENKMKANPHIALQGELVGEKIQDNRLHLKGKTVLFFSAYNMESGYFLPSDAFINLINIYNLETVPVIDENVLLPATVDEAVKIATRRSSLNPEVYAEGVVYRPMVELRDEDLGRLSFKVINPEYLLEYKE